MEEVLKAIPHRPPFLFVDKIIELTENRIKTKKTISPEESFFKGHYPGNPIMPGVLLCESIFQTGAILLSKILGMAENLSGRTPVLTRINDAKFKGMARPGDLLEIEAELVEKLSNAFFMKGTVKVAGKTMVRVEFACSLI
jgi:3-hydroxyacyl-[acyl-carrier-protein] dehydratase